MVKILSNMILVSKKVYIEEMKLLLDAMTKNQSMDIYKEAKAVVDG